MCNFKSAIVLRTSPNDVLHSQWTDSHEQLIDLFNIKDNREGNICRVEFSPATHCDLDKPEAYKLKIHQERTPDWFTKEHQEKVSAKLKTIIQNMIVDKPMRMMIGGAFIVTKGAQIECADHARIIVIRGGTVSTIRGGTVSAIWGGTVSAICGGTVYEIRGGTVSAIWGGTVSEIRGGTVSAIWGGTVSAIRGGTVSAIWGGTVSAICGGTVSEIWGGTVSEIWGGTVSEIRSGTVFKDYREKK